MGCGDPSPGNDAGWYKIFQNFKQDVVKVHNHKKNVLKRNIIQNY